MSGVRYGGYLGCGLVDNCFGNPTRGIVLYTIYTKQWPLACFVGFKEAVSQLGNWGCQQALYTTAWLGIVT